MNPLFIVGSPRSGTTLLVRLLNERLDLFIPPETEFFLSLDSFPQYRKGLGHVPVEEYRREYLRRRALHFLELQEDDLETCLPREAETIVDMFRALMACLLARSEQKQWGEKTPGHLRFAPEIARAFPNARFLLVVRDGRAVVNSRMRHPEWDDTLVSAAVRWRRDVLRGKRLLRSFGSRTCVVKYEELVASPDDTLAYVEEFLGVTRKQPRKDRGEPAGPGIYHSFYTQAWMAKASETPDRTRIEAWRDAFSETDLTLLTGMLYRELRSEGYACSPPSLASRATARWVRWRYFVKRVGRPLSRIKPRHD